MYLGIMVLSINDSYGKKGFYNSQEAGLARALSRDVERIVVYRFIDEGSREQESSLEGHDNITLRFIPSKRAGGNALPDVKKLDSRIDRLICFSDTQLGFPAIYRWCRKNNIDIYPYIGVTKSHSTKGFIRAASDLLSSRNMRLYRRCTCFAKTPSVVRELNERGVKRVTLIPVGLDEELLNRDFQKADRNALRREFGYEENDKVLLFIGRLIDEKEPVKLIGLFGEICKRNSACRLLMVGKGPLRAKVDEAIEAAGLKDRVRILEEIQNSEIWKLYRLSDVFVNLNRQEIFGMAILEALYYECRVVAYSAPGPDHILKEGEIVKSDEEFIEAVLREGNEPEEKHEKNALLWQDSADRILREMQSKPSDKASGRIIYASFMCSEEYFSGLFRDSPNMPGQAVQKYNRLLAEGLGNVPGISVFAVSEIPITRNNHKSLLYRGRDEKVNGVRYHYLPLINIHGIKDIGAVLSGFLSCVRLAVGAGRRTFVIADILNAPVALGSYIASRFAHIRYIAVVTDLPEYVYSSHDKAYSAVSRALLKRADSFVFLTKQMNDRYNRGRKPYVVIEGLVDNRKRKESFHKTDDVFRVVYTGSIHKKYGIGMLAEGFVRAGLSGAELHIYGNGDMKEELEKLSSQHENIYYHGSVIIEEAVRAQENAALLVNPRPSEGEYTKYSFPSKTMEYMVSGRPVLMTGLEGMPVEYHEHVWLLEDETVEGMASALKRIYEKAPSELSEKGQKAREFVLNNKNNAAQAQRLVRELNI